MSAQESVPDTLPLLLPWHEPLVRQVETAWRRGRLPHALLVHGPAGLGKQRFARGLAHALLCRAPGPGLAACGDCAACRFLAAGSHPDLAVIGPEEGKQQIPVDPIRSLAEWLAMTSHQSGWKIAIVDPAGLMTTAAANSLLKTLEEPPPRCLLVLVASTLRGIPATIRSRCQRLAMPRPSREAALEWLGQVATQEVSPQLLEFAGGAPLRAHAEAQGSFAQLDEEMQGSLGDLFSGRTDVTRVAQFWAKESLPARLTWLDLWLTSLAREALAGTGDLVTFPGQPVPLPRSAVPLNISRVYRLTDHIRELKGQLERVALNRDLAIEALLAELGSVLARR